MTCFVVAEMFGELKHTDASFEDVQEVYRRLKYDDFAGLDFSKQLAPDACFFGQAHVVPLDPDALRAHEGTQSDRGGRRCHCSRSSAARHAGQACSGLITRCSSSTSSTSRI